MKASYAHYTLHFRQPAGTSRGVLTDKETYFLKLEDEDMPGVFGLGECAVFRGLSADDVPAYEDKLRELCANISADKETDLHEFPSIRFGLETAINVPVRLHRRNVGDTHQRLGVDGDKGRDAAPHRRQNQGRVHNNKT